MLDQMNAVEELDLDMSFLDEVINQEFLAGEVIEEDDGAILLSALEEIENEEEMASIYASQDPIVELPTLTTVVGNDTPILSVSASATLGEEEVKVVRAHKARTVTPSSRILAKLGTEAVDYATLTTACASKDDTAIVEGLSATVDAMALYVSDKAVNLFDFLKTGGGLNAVTLRGFEVLIKDGRLVGGKDGNIVQNLLTKPYSLGTANSQSNQIIQLFTDLKIGTRMARGVVEINPDSIILERVKTLLGQ